MTSPGVRESTTSSTTTAPSPPATRNPSRTHRARISTRIELTSFRAAEEWITQGCFRSHVSFIPTVFIAWGVNVTVFQDQIQIALHVFPLTRHSEGLKVESLVLYFDVMLLCWVSTTVAALLCLPTVNIKVIHSISFVICSWVSDSVCWMFTSVYTLAWWWAGSRKNIFMWVQKSLFGSQTCNVPKKLPLWCFK